MEIVSCPPVSNQDSTSCNGDNGAKGKEVMADGLDDLADGGGFGRGKRRTVCEGGRGSKVVGVEVPDQLGGSALHLESRRG